MYGIQNRQLGIRDLVYNIDNGNIKLPKFQREFVWNIDKVSKLIDSIVKGFVVGSFTFWETKDRLKTIKNIGSMNLPEPIKGVLIQYVLDGQQRITTLYSIYKGEKVGNIDFKKIYIDLNINPYEYTSEMIIKHSINKKNLNKNDYIAVYELFSDDFFEKINQYTPEKQKIIREYQRRIENYSFSLILQTNNTPLSVAIEVFERMNTSGQKLSTFEVLTAKTYSEKLKFDLYDETEKLKDELATVGYKNISNNIILQIVAAILNNNVITKKLLDVKKENFINAWYESIEAIKKSS